jgi:hypothetical protein
MTTGAANIADNTTAQRSRAALQTRETLARLKARYPWPTERPSESPILWSLDYGGRRLITDAIASRGVNVLLEIGSFLGGSARQWLAASREVVVVCVDPGLTGSTRGRESPPTASAVPIVTNSMPRKVSIGRSFPRCGMSVTGSFTCEVCRWTYCRSCTRWAYGPTWCISTPTRRVTRSQCVISFFLTPSSPGTIGIGAMDTRFRFGNLHPDRHARGGVGSSVSEPRG